MLRVLGWVTLLILVGVATLPVGAQHDGEEAVPPVLPPMPISGMLRHTGYAVNDAEAAYLDADEQLTERYVTPLLTVELHAAFVTQDYSRQLILHLLREIAGLDPAGTRVAPPPSLVELERLAVARRTALQRAANQWLEGLEANDPAWVVRGSDAYGVARQNEGEWYVVLRQQLSAVPGGEMPGTPSAGPGATPFSR